MCLSPVLRYVNVLQRAVEGVEMVETLQKKNMGIKLPSRKTLFSPTQAAALMLCGQTLPVCSSLLCVAVR